MDTILANEMQANWGFRKETLKHPLSAFSFEHQPSYYVIYNHKRRPKESESPACTLINHSTPVSNPLPTDFLLNHLKITTLSYFKINLVLL